MSDVDPLIDAAAAGESLAADLAAPGRPPRRSHKKKPEPGEAVGDSSPAPPRPPGRGPGRPPSRPRTASLEQRLQASLSAIGMGVYMLNARDGEVIVNGTPALARSLAQLAAVNPTVKRTLEAAMSGGEVGAVIMSLLAILVPIAANHGLIPGQFVPASMAPPPPPAEDAMSDMATTVVGRVA